MDDRLRTDLATAARTVDVPAAPVEDILRRARHRRRLRLAPMIGVTAALTAAVVVSTALLAGRATPNNSTVTPLDGPSSTPTTVAASSPPPASALPGYLPAPNADTLVYFGALSYVQRPPAGTTAPVSADRALADYYTLYPKRFAANSAPPVTILGEYTEVVLPLPQVTAVPPLPQITRRPSSGTSNRLVWVVAQSGQDVYDPTSSAAHHGCTNFDVVDAHTGTGIFSGSSCGSVVINTK